MAARGATKLVNRLRRDVVNDLKQESRKARSCSGSEKNMCGDAGSREVDRVGLILELGLLPENLRATKLETM